MFKIEKWDGKVITRPGIYSDVPIDIYHSQEICDAPSVSSTGLRRVLERNDGSPAHFYDEWSGNPNCQDQNEKVHYIFGRAVHHLILGEDLFASKFAIREEANPAWDSWKTLAAKQWRDARAAEGRAAITAADIADIRGIANALHNHKEFNPLVRYGDGELRHYSMLNGHVETSFFWRDKTTSFWCKARPDAIPTASGDYADLKTTTSVSFVSLTRTITDFAYHQQAALIAEGSQQCAGMEMASYTLVFVEKKRPWCVRLVPMHPEDIQIGRQQNRIALDLIARCYVAKDWPGPGEMNISTIRLSQNYRATLKTVEEAA